MCQNIWCDIIFFAFTRFTDKDICCNCSQAGEIGAITFTLARNLHWEPANMCTALTSVARLLNRWLDLGGLQGKGQTQVFVTLLAASDFQSLTAKSSYFLFARKVPSFSSCCSVIQVNLDVKMHMPSWQPALVTSRKKMVNSDFHDQLAQCKV